jgi:hypothetical protein
MFFGREVQGAASWALRYGYEIPSLSSGARLPSWAETLNPLLLPLKIPFPLLQYLHLAAFTFHSEEVWSRREIWLTGLDPLRSQH